MKTGSKKKTIKDFNGEIEKSYTPQKNVRKKVRFSILTFLLIIFLCQLTCGVVVNVAKIYSLRTKIATLEKINKVAEKKNQYLREEIEKYTSNTGVEALARNRLQFSKDDETLVIIKNVDEENAEEEKTKGKN